MAIFASIAASLSRKDLPYKVATYDPQDRTYNIVTSKWTFGEAYSHPLGTHVVQTHGTEAELQRMVTGQSGAPSGSDVARNVGAGFLIAGAPGAAVGGLLSGSRYGRWYELPHPIITRKETK